MKFVHLKLSAYPDPPGQTMNYQLKSSDKLPVGRYVLAVREKATGGAGYGRFIISDSELI